MSEFAIPEEISDDEDIARLILSSSLVDDGVLSPTAFNLRDLNPPEDYVSVLRHMYFVPTKENTAKIGRKNVEKYGYALLNVGICRGISFRDIKLELLHHPTNNYPSHAGIHFTKNNSSIKGRCMDPDFIVVLSMLAGNSRVIQF